MVAPLSRRTLLSAGFAVLAGCTSARRKTDTAPRQAADDPSATEHEIEIYDDEFHPGVLELSVGDRVVWRNTDTGVYTVTADQETVPPDADYFSSGGSGSETIAQLFYPFLGRIENGETYTHRPTVPGEYEYYSISQQSRGHEMSGTLIVK